MSDIYDSSKRSQVMSKVRNKNTRPEIYVKSLLCQLGYRQYRLSTKKINCRPDIVFIGMRKAIFVNGCFWHGHICKKAHLPSSNVQFWQTKIERNKRCDSSNYHELEEKGWSYLVIWECELKKKNEVLLKNKIDTFIRDK